MRIKTRRSDEGIIPASYVALRLEILHAVVVRLKATEWQTFAARWKDRGTILTTDAIVSETIIRSTRVDRAFPRRRIFRRISFPRLFVAP